MAPQTRPPYPEEDHMPPEPATTLEQIRAYLQGNGMLLYPAPLLEPVPSSVLTRRLAA